MNRLRFCLVHSQNPNNTGLRSNRDDYAFLATLDRSHLLLAPFGGSDPFSDYKNLIFLFNPMSLIADVSQGELSKGLRCTLCPTLFRYTFFHINGNKTVRAGFIGRWPTVLLVQRIVYIPLYLLGRVQVFYF